MKYEQKKPGRMNAADNQMLKQCVVLKWSSSLQAKPM